MKTLLPYNHPTYLRRMARELSNRSAGFYYGGERFSRATFSTLTGLTIWRTVEFYGNGRRKEATKNFTDVSEIVFGDGNGGTICASRQQS